MTSLQWKTSFFVQWKDATPKMLWSSTSNLIIIMIIIIIIIIMIITTTQHLIIIRLWLVC